MAKKKRSKIESADQVVTGSTNVFADLVYKDAEEHKAKAMLVSRIARLIQRQKLTQADVAQRLGIDQPKISAMLNGRFRGFSVYRLMQFVSTLGIEVNIVTKDPREPSKVEAIAVHA